ncbi:MAG: alginate lyase family protein [Paludibacteraceae bacterium]|nr:alginate lyase family protein [Paludibacteraceae bacterium]
MKKLIFCFMGIGFSILSLTLHAQPRIWNLNQINSAKNSNLEVVNAVIGEADKHLTATIATVMDKPLTPASGDKHDYMSMGRYWWPNPNTKDGLPYIRRDGVSNPELEKLDRNSLSKMARSVVILSLAYHLTNKDEYAQKAVKNLKTWFLDKKTKMNPNMNFGQTIPGRNNGKGRGEGVLDSYSFVEMLDAVELLKSSNKFTMEDQAALKDWFSAYLNWMLTSEIGQEEYNAKNNHGTAFDVQVVRYALFTGNKEVADKFVKDFPERRIFTQIEPNGAQTYELQRTKAFGYSVYNLTHFMDMAFLAKSMNQDIFHAVSSDGRSIVKAIDFLIPYVGKPSSEFPYQQIQDWDKEQSNFCWVLKRADILTGMDNYKDIYSKYLPNKRKDLNYLIY